MPKLITVQEWHLLNSAIQIHFSPVLKKHFLEDVTLSIDGRRELGEYDLVMRKIHLLSVPYFSKAGRGKWSWGGKKTNLVLFGAAYSQNALFVFLHELGHFLHLDYFDSPLFVPITWWPQKQITEAEGIANLFSWYLLYPEDGIQRLAARNKYANRLAPGVSNPSGRLNYSKIYSQIQGWEEREPALFQDLRVAIKEVKEKCTWLKSV